MACVLSAHTLSVQKGSLCHPAFFDFAAVLDNEMDVIAASNNHENGPQTGVSLTYGVYPAPYKRGLRDDGAWRWFAAAGMTKEAALLLFNSVLSP